MIVIVGPTASGKSELAVYLARQFLGEVVSADSRQVYRGMDIGSGKVTEAEKKGVKHHLLDVASPKKTFSAGQYQAMAQKSIENIQKRGRLPILCGGTGFYVKSVAQQTILPKAAPDWRLRAQLAKKSPAQLFERLKKIDPVTAARIDRNNPRRLIRALEIVIKTGHPVPAAQSLPLPYAILVLGLSIDKNSLKKRIARRLKARVKRGMLAEVKRLHASGISWKRLENFGLEYRYAAMFLQGKISRTVMEKSIKTESERYAKRQMTWFLRDRSVIWIKTKAEAKKLASRYLSS